MDRTQHPEFELVRWAAESLDEKERAEATVYTSGEHCPMCSAAYAWAGLGPIVYAVSGATLAVWQKEWDVPASPVAGLGVDQVAPHVPTRGPFPLLEDTMKALHHRVRRTLTEAASPGRERPFVGDRPFEVGSTALCPAG